MTIRSFGPRSNPLELIISLYRGQMTAEEPLDDEMFINSNFLANWRYRK